MSDGEANKEKKDAAAAAAAVGDGVKPAYETTTEKPAQAPPAYVAIKPPAEAATQSPAAVVGNNSWTLTKPISFNSSLGTLIYDAILQTYFIPYQQQWLRVHVVERTTITKEEARRFVKEHPTWTHALENLPKVFPNVKPATVAVVPLAVLVYNALHDSVVVKRNKEDTGLAQFYIDKTKTPYKESVPAMLGFIRPEYKIGCPCTEMQTYESVVYCPGCMTFRRQQQTITQTSATQATVSMSYATLAVVGKVVLFKPVVDFIVNEYCKDRGSGAFAADATLNTMASIFFLAGLKNVPIPAEVVVRHVMRDSLYVRKFDDKVLSWADYFGIDRKGRESAIGAGEAIALLRLGLAIGTLGMIS